MATLISTTATLIPVEPPLDARPTRRVFTAEGTTWRLYVVPNSDPAVPWESQEFAYPADPAEWY